MLTVTFQSDPELHPDLYGQFTERTQTDPALDAWIEDMHDYTLSFQHLDGTECRDLVWEKQLDGRNLFTEMKFAPERCFPNPWPWGGLFCPPVGEFHPKPPNSKWALLLP